jgi:hypothetical protein
MNMKLAILGALSLFVVGCDNRSADSGMQPANNTVEVVSPDNTFSADNSADNVDVTETTHHNGRTPRNGHNLPTN